MQGLSAEEVEHVADLANVMLTEEEKAKFSRQLNDILADVDKICAVDIDEEARSLLSPSDNKNLYHNDETQESLTVEEIKKNANKTSGDYITVEEKHD